MKRGLGQPDNGRCTSRHVILFDMFWNEKVREGGIASAEAGTAGRGMVSTISRIVGGCEALCMGRTPGGPRREGALQRGNR
jgi:hypothetical protein